MWKFSLFQKLQSDLRLKFLVLDQNESRVADFIVKVFSLYKDIYVYKYIYTYIYTYIKNLKAYTEKLAKFVITLFFNIYALNKKNYNCSIRKIT